MRRAAEYLIKAGATLMVALGLVSLCASLELTATGQSSGETQGLAIVLEVDGAIGPASAGYLTNGLEDAAEDGANLVIIRMDTPGGLTTSTRDINDAILASPVPVLTWVGPSGARAASAGTYILYASHIAAMAPGTTIGAATPVQMGGGEAENADPKTSKAINDAAAYMRTLANLRGRNAEWGERAVREAATLTGEEAVEENVADFIAADLDTVVELADGRKVRLGEAAKVLSLANIRIDEREPNWRDNFLAIITNPNVALILVTLGVYGLFFEFANPGALAPGILGGMCLLIGLYALNVLPVNYAGLALIALGLALMTAEAFAPSFGLLGLGGIAAFSVGGVILFDAGVPGFSVSWWTVGILAALSAVVLVFLIGYMIRAQRRPLATGEATLVGRSGDVHDWSGQHGRVSVQGELWNATGPESLTAGERVRIASVDGLTLTVVPSDSAALKAASGQAGGSS